MIQKIQHQDTQLLFGADLSLSLNKILKNNYSNSKKIIITDENVFSLWIENLISSVEELHHAEIIQLPAGEEQKTIEICYQVWQTLSDYKIGRQDLILNFGGGVISDMGGFIASTYKRGLNFINIPTTLLSQVDASIGGKTGVDLGMLKNQIGVFSNPNYVFINYKYLETLADIELKSGFAEMLKHGLIQSAPHWHNLTLFKSYSANNVSPYIFDSVMIKHQIVSRDPKENNERKSLNFGHTVGHAFESYLLHKQTPAPHGFCVAWGMVVESELSEKLTKESKTLISNCIDSIYSSCPIGTDAVDDLIELMHHDKKNENDTINFTLLNSIGSYLINQSVNETKLKQTLLLYLD